MKILKLLLYILFCIITESALSQCNTLFYNNTPLEKNMGRLMLPGLNRNAPLTMFAKNVDFDFLITVTNIRNVILAGSPLEKREDFQNESADLYHKIFISANSAEPAYCHTSEGESCPHPSPPRWA